jgi:hypothetical protein
VLTIEVKMKTRTFPMVVLALAMSGYAQQASPADGKKLPDILADMKSEDMHTKVVAFNELMAYVDSEAGPPPNAAKSPPFGCPG